MIEPCNFSNQQAKRRILIFTFIICLTSQFLSQNPFQLLIIGCGHWLVMRQLINRQTVGVFNNISINSGTIVFKIISGFQLHPLLLSDNWICEHRFNQPRSRLIINKLHEFSQFISDLLKYNRIVQSKKLVVLDRPNKLQFFLDLRDARLALQARCDSLQSFFRLTKR